MDDFDPNAIIPEQALKNILKQIQAIDTTETVPISKSLGRILAEDIIAQINVPSSKNSAMDGYAFGASDLPEKGVKQLKCIGTCFAGKPFKETVNKGECIRIMTGAVIPKGTDTVVIQEHSSVSGDLVEISNDIKPGTNIRKAGEDLAMGDRVLEKGIRMMPADIGLLASLGRIKINVYRNIKVAFFSTGDELRSIGETLEEGTIYDSNRYTLYNMLARLGVQITDMGVIKDNKLLLEQAFLEASNIADMLITSGGVSVGEADYIKETLEDKGDVNFWKVAMKPGRPLTFGKIDKTWFFGLPGNPVSVMTTFYQFVQPALKRLMGEKYTPPIMLAVPCLSKLKKRAGRVEYQRGILEKDENGCMIVRKTGKQGSGILHSMSDANCFIVLPLENEGVNPGDKVDVQLFYGLI